MYKCYGFIIFVRGDLVFVLIDTTPLGFRLAAQYRIVLVLLCRGFLRVPKFVYILFPVPLGPLPYTPGLSLRVQIFFKAFLNT